jgi:hypothetical protein
VIALPLLLALQAGPPAAPQATYEALVARAVAAARAGERAGAETLLQRARALDPARPEAMVELAGLRFLDGRYPEAVELLRPVVRRGSGGHARDLLATSLHLAGRPDEAVEAWNPMRRPILRNVRVNGMHDTRARLVVPQLSLVEGAVLTRDDLRETRLRLAETGAFARVAVRPVPLGTGEADVDVSLVERRGLGSAPELAATTLGKALQRTAWLRYDNLDGTGISVRACYRWERTQPRAEVALAWPRPLGLDVTLHAAGEWERARYEFDTGGLTLEARGAQVALRRILDARTVGELRWRGRTRTFAEASGERFPAARTGRVSGLSLRVERRLAEGRRHALEAAATAFSAARPLGSEIGFATVRLGVRGRLAAGDPRPPGRSGSALAAQVVLGHGTRGTPLDELFVPGAASEMDLPLRAHRSRSGGVLGATPIGRSLALANLEWRPRLARWGPAEVGGAVFSDTALVGGTVANPGHRFLHDVGAGFRVGAMGVVIRVDYAVSLTRPRSHAWTAGLGQAF